MSAASKLLPLGGLAIIAAATWAYLFTIAMTFTKNVMTMPDGALMTVPIEWAPAHVMRLFLMWAVMTVAMMLPSALPAAARLSGPPMLRFAGAYTAAWIAFAVAATLSQWLLSSAGLMSDGMALSNKILAGAILIAIGLYHLTPLTAQDLERCHNRKDYVVACLRCCAPLMLIMFVVGTMNLTWSIGLTLFVATEKAWNRGVWLAWVGGLTLVTWGASQLLST